MTRYAFDEVRAALHGYWGLALHRGGAMSDGAHDGRWDAAYSKTGFVIVGNLPRRGHGCQRFRALVAVVDHWELADLLAEERCR